MMLLSKISQTHKLTYHMFLSCGDPKYKEQTKRHNRKQVDRASSNRNGTKRFREEEVLTGQG